MNDPIEGGPGHSDFSVVIATYGDTATWGPLALRALTSVSKQTREPATINVVHGSTLAEARNRGGLEAAGEWLIFLDADDELDVGYIAAMETVADALVGQQHALLKPATLGVYPDGAEDDAPVMIPARPLLEANHCVIGTAMRRVEFLDEGGFKDMPALEDWHLFIRLQIAGAHIIEVPGAVYRVGVNPESRNQDHAAHGRAYQRIRQEFGWLQRR